MEGILGNIRGVVHTHIAGRGKVLVVVDDSVLLGGVNCRNAAGLPMGPRRQTGRLVPPTKTVPLPEDGVDAQK